MKVSVDKRVKKTLDGLSKVDSAKVNRVVELFSEKGFIIGEPYLKKLNKSIWELRPGRVRMLFGIVDEEVIIVNVFIKKTAKTPLKEIRLAESRLRNYI